LKLFWVCFFLYINFFGLRELVAMHPWRARLQVVRELLLEDEREDDFVVQCVVGLQMEIERTRAAGGSQLGRHTNIGRDRKEMHAQMIKDYFL
jgi:hypothetical protein